MVREVRALALLAVSALLGQHAVELVHALTTDHVRCAEHGELVEVGDRAAEPSPVDRLEAAPSQEGRLLDHEHCAVEWLAQFQVATSEPSLGTGLRSTSVEAPFAPPIPSAARSLLRVAPKTSPPILA